MGIVLQVFSPRQKHGRWGPQALFLGFHTHVMVNDGSWWWIAGVGKCPILGILNITFKYLLEIISPIFGWCSKPLLVDDSLGDYTTLHILGIMIIQERGIPIKQPGLNGMIEGFWTLLIWASWLVTCPRNLTVFTKLLGQSQMGINMYKLIQLSPLVWD